MPTPHLLAPDIATWFCGCSWLIVVGAGWFVVVVAVVVGDGLVVIFRD
jgi:hypothetical protein